MEERVQARRVMYRQIRTSKSLRSDGDLLEITEKEIEPRCQEKLLARTKVPVP